MYDYLGTCRLVSHTGSVTAVVRSSNVKRQLEFSGIAQHWAPMRVHSAIHASSQSSCRNPRCILQRHASPVRPPLLRFTAAKAASDEDRASSTLSSLDSLLGSQDSQDEERPSLIQLDPPPQPQPQPLQVPVAYLQRLGIYLDAESVSAPRVPPVLSVVLYYWSIVLYLASVYLNTVEGPGAGDDFTESLANDHLAVAQGHHYLRLLTSPLVHHSPLSLLITLVALGLVGAELEATAGYFAFACVVVLGAAAAGVADILVADLPVTQGAVPAISAMVTALFVNQLKNGAIKEQATAALTAAQQQQQQALLQRTFSSGSSSSVDSGQPGDGTSQALQDDERRASGAAASTSQSSSGSSQPLASREGLQQGGASSTSGKPEIAEVEFLEGLFKVGVASSPAVKAVVGGATTFIACFEALSDLQNDGNVTTSLAGIVAGMAAGAALSAGVGPQFEAACVPSSKLEEELGRSLPVASSTAAGERLFLRIRDGRPWPLKVLVALGSTALLTSILKLAV